MKLLIALLFSVCLYSQNYTVVQINADWNERNKIDLPFKIEGAKVIYAYLSEQPESLQKQVKVVPVVVLYKDSKPVRQWIADLSFKMPFTKDELIAQIKKEINSRK
jgi:hypothetical protein